eukprot:410489-Amorphochlora_amoeboformis.AAC.1
MATPRTQAQQGNDYVHLNYNARTHTRPSYAYLDIRSKYSNTIKLYFSDFVPGMGQVFEIWTSELGAGHRIFALVICVSCTHIERPT